MRIERLSLDFFGHFTGKVIDFGAAPEGSDFHVVYGPNEAGKTTLMEGYLRLLYGFEAREPYDFQHKRQNLRVSGVFDLGGEQRALTRLPARKGNLRGPNDEVVPETAIAAHLGGLTIDEHRSLLSLDDKTIEAGGMAILAAKGKFGDVLFSAMGGIPNLTAILEGSRDEAGAIFRKRASTTRVAGLKRELAEVEAAIREGDISAGAWRKLKDALDATQQAEATARQARDDQRVEEARVAALRRALPGLQEIDRLLRDAPDAAGMGDAEASTLAERLEALDDLRGRFHAADTDLPKRRAEVDEATADMQAVARDLGAADGCDVAALVLSPADIADLEAAREAVRDAAAAQASAVEEVSDLQAKAGEAERKLDAEIQDAPVATGLGDLLAEYDADALAPAVAAAKGDVANAEDALADALDALTVGSYRFTALPACSMGVDAAAGLAERSRDLSAKVDRLDDRIENLDREIAAMTARLAQFAGSVGVATDEDLQAAIAERDALWQAHRDTLDAESADHFLPAMARVDDIHAARLAHANELGAIRKTALDLAEARARLETAQRQRAKLVEEAQAVDAQAAEVCQGVGLPDMPAVALAPWIAAHANAAAAVAQRDRRLAAHQHTLDRSDALRAALAPRLGRADIGFEAALSEGRRLAEAERRHAETREAAAGHLRQLKADLVRRQAQADNAGAAAKEAAGTWTARVQALLNDMVPADGLAASLSLLAQMREHAGRRDHAKRQVRGMEADQQAFSQAVMELVAEHGLDAGDPVDGFARLRGMVETRRRLQDLSARALQDLSVPTLDAAHALLGDATAADLEAWAQSLGADLDRAEAQVTEATADRVRAERDLAEVTGDARIAELVERRATLQIEIETSLLDYLELDLGLRLADEAIRRFRDRHRSEMMEATDRAFAGLTNGAYGRLITQSDGGADVLKAVDASGTPKDVDDMSKGTRFQLYLALRAAAYEQMVGQGVTLPFFCDDVFETFDEDRTRAACRLMERIGTHGQAIYLTHHAHVVDIAREVASTPPRVHEL